MIFRAPRQPFALDPLIAEAKRRARQRRFLGAVSALTLLAVAAGLALQLPSSGRGTRTGLAGDRGVDALTIPKGTDGIAVVVYGRLSVTTKTGFHIHGLSVGVASLSPRARYVAAGIGNALTELAPSGRRVWSQPVGNPVADCGACNSVATVSWSPDGSRIAYLARTSTNSGNQVLHVIRRDGTHDTVIDSNAQGGQPSWRADSRALAYIGAGGKPIIYDLAHRSRHVITWPAARSLPTHLAFAPRGGDLAIATETAALLVGGHDEVVWRGQTHGVNWLGGRLAVSERLAPSGRHGHYVTQLYTVTHSGVKLSRTIRLPGPIVATHGRTIALGAGNSVLAGPIGSLQKVFRFRIKPVYSGCACGELPFARQSISFG